MSNDYWMENAMGGQHTLVDMGDANERPVRDATYRVAKHLSCRNVQIVSSGRVIIRIPPTKVRKILSAFPEIKLGTTWAWCTHHWKEQS